MVIFNSQNDLKIDSIFSLKGIRESIQTEELVPKFCLLHYRLGEILAEHDRLEEAIKCFKRSIQLNPNSYKIYGGSDLSKIEDRYEYNNFFSYLENAIANEIKIVDLYYSLGNYFLQDKKYHSATECYLTSLEFAPKFWQSWYKLGSIPLEQKKWKQAIAKYLKALSVEPGEPTIVKEIVNILNKQGDTENAYLCWKQQNIPVEVLKNFPISSKDWSIIDRTDEDKTIRYIDIYPRSEVFLPLPKTIYPEVSEIFSRDPIKFKESYVSIIQDGYSWSNLSTTAVITKKNELVSELSTGCSNIVVASDRINKPLKIDGTVVFLSSRWGSRAYFHWMVETLPRIELLRQSGISLNSIEKFCFYNCDTRFNLDTLKILGIDRQQIINSCEHPYIQAKKLIVPSTMYGSRFAYWSIDFLRRKFLPPQAVLSKSYRRIYISRKSTRKIKNEDLVENILRKFGFKTYTLESMSVLEQASLMASAEVVVAPHGAGLTNLLFCSSGTKVIEIFSPRYIRPFYWVLSNQCELDYYYLIGEDFVDENQKPGSQDIQVNLKSLLEILDLAKIK